MKQVLLGTVWSFLVIFSGGYFNYLHAQCSIAPNGIAIDVANNTIYWSELGSNQIMTGNLDGTGTPTVLFDIADGVFQPRDVDIDVANNLIFWAQMGPPPHTIMSGALDGTGVPVELYNSFVDGIFGPNGIVADFANNRLFWGENQGQAILEGDPAGVTSTVLFDNTDGVEGARGIAIDLVNSKIYWADFDSGTPNGRIFEGNLDGMGTPTTLFNLGLPSFPHSVAIDVPNGLIYWTDVIANEINVGSLDGTGTPTTLFQEVDGISGPRHLELDAVNGKLYWTELEDGQIVSGNADGIGTPSILFYKIWDGGGDGINWDDALNWSDDTEPVAGDFISIPDGATVTIQMAGEVADAIFLIGNSSLTINAGADLTVANGLCRNAIKLQSGSSLNVNGLLNVFNSGDDGIDMTTNTQLNVGASGNLTIIGTEENAIDIEGGILTNFGIIDISASTNSGICLLNLNGTPARATNNGIINIDTSIDSADGNGIEVRGSIFSNFGTITVSITGNDGIRLETVNQESSFINQPGGSISLLNIGDDAIDINSNSFINNGDIIIDIAGDNALSMDAGSSFTNGCTMLIIDAQVGIANNDGAFTNSSSVNISLDAGSTAPALVVGSTVNNATCAIFNIASDNEILIIPGGTLTNEGVITTTYAGSNDNNGTFLNTGEIRPATYVNGVNAITGNAPLDGAVPATEALNPAICSACPVMVVPTLSQWGLIILALCLMTFGTLHATSSKLVGTNEIQINTFAWKQMPIIWSQYFKIWVAIAFIVFISFILLIQFFEYEMTAADPFGAFVSSGIAAYLVFLLGNSK